MTRPIPIPILRKRRLRLNSSAVSPVIATILLVAMTIVITAGLWLWMQSFVPTGKTLEPDVQASVQQQANGDYYVTITSMAENLGVESIEFYIEDSNGISVSPSVLQLDHDSVYGNIYIDSDQNGFLSSGDFFIIQHKDNGGYGESGGALVLISRPGNQVILSAQLR